MTHPYAVPNRLPPELARVQAYWKGLLRGSAEMPFWDDAKLTDLPDLKDRLFLVDVFDRPERFRLATVGGALTEEALAGLFVDETRLGAPFELLGSQCSAAVESAAPTFFRHDGGRTSEDPRYSRLLLPMWGDGRIGMLLGAVDFD